MRGKILAIKEVSWKYMNFVRFGVSIRVIDKNKE